MIGSDLIVEIPWIIFGVLLAAACLRLRRFRRFPGRPRDRESSQRPDDGNDASESAGVFPPEKTVAYSDNSLDMPDTRRELQRSPFTGDGPG